MGHETAGKVSDWFAEKEFTSDWTSPHIARWTSVLGSLRTEAIRILEIGSWEGRSAVFFLRFLPRSTITCIDTFGGGGAHMPDHVRAEVPNVEARFDANLAEFGERVRKIKATSAAALAALQNGTPFDLIYIDGNHERDAVLTDSLLAWPLLWEGGLLIWDDYRGGRDKPLAIRPKPAIDTFLWLHRRDASVVRRESQVIVRKVDKPVASRLQTVRAFLRTMST
jgi:predicted O-methyltransferase YrrM